MGTVWNALFQVDSGTCDSGRPGVDRLLFYCAICLWLLMRKVRAYEVIK
jgi:hypothetical protein